MFDQILFTVTLKLHIYHLIIVYVPSIVVSRIPASIIQTLDFNFDISKSQKLAINCLFYLSLVPFPVLSLLLANVGLEICDAGYWSANFETNV
jgi:hypothetical protein